MTTELTCLLLSAVLALVHVTVQALFYRRQIGIRDANNTRDHEPAPDLMTGRATRALRNFLETYAAFVALVVVIMLAHRSNAATQSGAIAYVVARLVYLPLYVLGISPARSIVWTIAFAGLLAMIAGSFIG